VIGARCSVCGRYGVLLSEGACCSRCAKKLKARQQEKERVASLAWVEELAAAWESKAAALTVAVTEKSERKTLQRCAIELRERAKEKS
jgi:hypothetical protein